MIHSQFNLNISVKDVYNDKDVRLVITHIFFILVSVSLLYAKKPL